MHIKNSKLGKQNLSLMHSVFLLLVGFILVTNTMHATEYLYPVGSITSDNSTKMYVIYQKSPEHLELWLWDPITKIATKGLLPTYTPAGLQVLPSGKGFSFIDNGRIRVKEFTKRSPKTLAINEPIYDISLIHWIDDESFYLSAKCYDNFGIFFGTMQGTTMPMLIEDGTDFMYPQKIDAQIFYIERVSHGEQFLYSIKVMAQPTCQLGDNTDFNDVEHFEQKNGSVDA